MSKKNTPEYINEVQNRTELSLSDEWETPNELYDYLTSVYEFYPYCDVCADRLNTKCPNWYDNMSCF